MTKEEEKRTLKQIEVVLFCYNKYQKKIEKYIKEFKNPVIVKKYNQENIKGTGYIEIKSEIEKVEEMRKRISDDISRCEEMLFRIDSALEMIKDHKDYSFIEMRYMQGMTYEAIAEQLDVSNVSVYTMRNNILRVLKIHFIAQKLL